MTLEDHPHNEYQVVNMFNEPQDLEEEAFMGWYCLLCCSCKFVCDMRGFTAIEKLNYSVWKFEQERAS